MGPSRISYEFDTQYCFSKTYEFTLLFIKLFNCLLNIHISLYKMGIKLKDRTIQTNINIEY